MRNRQYPELTFAALDLCANDFTQVLRLQVKGGVQRDIPAHPKLAEDLDKWIHNAQLRGSDFLFSALPRTGRVASQDEIQFC
ncbi:hypothetical protein CCB80_02220 [Armatimonadetes bacterium Uphvl-Ar1]|nr:hypothetical protein CCB80_02220 [Armatimonadetes bacterium Uphvl-Ar1]